MTVPWSIPFAAGFFAYPVVKYISLLIIDCIKLRR